MLCCRFFHAVPADAYRLVTRVGSFPLQFSIFELQNGLDGFTSLAVIGLGFCDAWRGGGKPRSPVGLETPRAGGKLVAGRSAGGNAEFPTVAGLRETRLRGFWSSRCMGATSDFFGSRASRSSGALEY
jgi:hypothetical protein